MERLLRLIQGLLYSILRLMFVNGILGRACGSRGRYSFAQMTGYDKLGSRGLHIFYGCSRTSFLLIKRNLGRPSWVSNRGENSDIVSLIVQQ